MVSFILVIAFTIFAFLESFSYAIYEIKINQNKFGGITLILLALVGLIFPISVYLTK